MELNRVFYIQVYLRYHNQKLLRFSLNFHNSPIIRSSYTSTIAINNKATIFPIKLLDSALTHDLFKILVNLREELYFNKKVKLLFLLKY